MKSKREREREGGGGRRLRAGKIRNACLDWLRTRGMKRETGKDRRRERE